MASPTQLTPAGTGQPDSLERDTRMTATIELTAHEVTGITCTKTPRGSYTGKCGRPATKAERSTSIGSTVRYEPRCGMHARSTYATYVDLTPEVVGAIREEQARAAEATAQLKAQCTEQSRIAHERATIAAQAETRQAWVAVRDDEQRPNWEATRAAGEERYDVIPRWAVTAPGVEARSWDAMEVKAIELYGERRLEVRNGSRLTARQARALAQALLAAADVIDG